MELKGKKVIIIGDRDGIPGEAIKLCAESAGAEVVYAATECFVWTSAGAMDLENQKRVKDLAEAESSGLACETVTNGDPTFAGPLAGVSLGLLCYHVVEPEIKNQIDPKIYEEQISMMEMVLDVPAIIAEVKEYREKYCKFLK